MVSKYAILHDKLFKKLQRACLKNPQYPLVAAYLLNYKSSMVIEQWLRREKIPHNKLIELKGILDGKINVTVS